MIKIVSTAQHAMFERAARDPDYAKERGIDQSLAQEAMDAHKADGAPKLPERATGKTRPKAVSLPPGKPVFLSSRRAD